MSNMKQSRRLDQQGIASLFFTLIMMAVITIIVIGFAQLARRGQRETLDSQLSTQAYYAAESGVNDATNVLQNPDGVTLPSDSATNCTSFITAYGLSSTLSADNNVAYTCLLVDSGPQAYLDYSNTISRTQAQIIPIEPTSSAAGITVSWSQPSGSSGSPTLCDNLTNIDVLPSQSNYRCPFPMLRIDLVPKPSGSFTAASLQAAAFTVFAKPLSSGGGTVAVSHSGQRLAGGNCTATTCSLTLSGLSGNYMMHVSSLYADPLDVRITPTTGQLSGAQAVVDVTGKAQDVLRRVRVRVPTGGFSAPVSAAIQSNQSLCKRFTIRSGQSLNTASLCNGSGSGAPATPPAPVTGPAHTTPIAPVNSCWRTAPANYERLRCWDPTVQNTTAAFPAGSLDHCTWSWYYTDIATNTKLAPTTVDTYGGTAPQCQTGGSAAHQFTPKAPPGGNTANNYTYGCTLTNYFKNGAIGTYDTFQCGGVPF